MSSWPFDYCDGCPMTIDHCGDHLELKTKYGDPLIPGDSNKIIQCKNIIYQYKKFSKIMELEERWLIVLNYAKKREEHFEILARIKEMGYSTWRRPAKQRKKRLLQRQGKCRLRLYLFDLQELVNLLIHNATVYKDEFALFLEFGQGDKQNWPEDARRVFDRRIVPYLTKMSRGEL